MWVPVKMFSDYEVNENGLIRKRENKTIVKQHINNRFGYSQVKIKRDDGVRITSRVHILTWDSFNPYIIKPKGFELHHVDGNKQNNGLSNLMLVSHKDNIKFLTEYRSKKAMVLMPRNICIICGVVIDKKASMCAYHAHKKSRKINKSPKEIQEIIISNDGNFSKVGRDMGVDGNAIRKFLRLNNLPYHSSDYKNK